jgi:hypothetical protein
MRRALGWLTGLVGVAALARLLQGYRRRAGAHAPALDPADELRETLARSRAGEPGAVGPGEQPEPTSPEERRAQVHAHAQQAIDRMREPSEGR